MDGAVENGERLGIICMQSSMDLPLHVYNHLEYYKLLMPFTRFNSVDLLEYLENACCRRKAVESSRELL